MITTNRPSTVPDLSDEPALRRALVPGFLQDRALELAVFLLLLVPPLVISFFVVPSGNGFPIVAASTIARDVALIALIAFFMHMSGERLKAIGWRAGSAPQEVLIGVGLFPVIYAASIVIEAALRSAGLSGPTARQPELVPGPDAAQLLLAVVLVAVVAFAEETIFRGYLMRRIEQVTGNATAALVLSALVFASGHAYEGASGVVTVGLFGLALGLIYRWRTSLIAPIVVHFLFDAAAIIVVPLLVGR